MRIWLIVLIGVLFCGSAMAGTLIYKNKAGEVKRVSGLKILSIDGKKMVVKIDSGTETISLAQVQKYYDTDIRIGGEFDDDSGAYSVRLGTESLVKAKKSGGRQEFSIPFSLTRAQGVSIRSRLRQPYFYLFVLVSDGEGQRKMQIFSYPKSAKAGMKNYDEAKMLEKVIELDRPYYYHEDTSFGSRSTQKRLGGERVASFPLASVRNGSVIAWYLVVWGKDSIVATKEWHDTGRNVGKNWWVR